MSPPRLVRLRTFQWKTFWRRIRGHLPMSSCLTIYNNFLRTKSPIFVSWEVLSRQGLLFNIVVFCFQTFLQISQRQRKEDGGCLLNAVMSARRSLETFYLYSLVVNVGQPGLLILWLGYMPDPFKNCSWCKRLLWFTLQFNVLHLFHVVTVVTLLRVQGLLFPIVKMT